jgi:hypothetical protein
LSDVLFILKHNLGTELFVTEVEAHPAKWDTKPPLYSGKGKRQGVIKYSALNSTGHVSRCYVSFSSSLIC